MSAKVFFISDLHLGHHKIIEFAKGYRVTSTLEAHDDWIVHTWNSIVTKRDVVYVLGDVAFSRAGLQRVKELKGVKKFIPGNHDNFKLQEYEQVGLKFEGALVRYKEFWLSHAPIHPEELRGKRNIHGHVHHKTLGDDRYINVSVENVKGKPLFLDTLRTVH